MQHDPTGAFANLEFGVGQPVPRKEDPRLVSGRGRFTDDVSLPGQAFARVVRSTHAHGTLRHLDVGAARGSPGVLAVYTAEDLARAGYGDLPCKVALQSVDGSALFAPPRPALARDRVRHVGEPLAVVIPRLDRSARTMPR